MYGSWLIEIFSRNICNTKQLDFFIKISIIIKIYVHITIMKKTPHGRWTSRGSKMKSLFMASSLLSIFSVSTEIMAQENPLYTQSSQWWICVTKQEFKRRCGLHDIPQSQIDSVHVGENMWVNLGYRISTDNAENTFYWINTKWVINHESLVTNNVDTIKQDGYDITGLDESDKSSGGSNHDDNIIKQKRIWKTITPIIPQWIDLALQEEINKFFGEFSVSSNVMYSYVWPETTITLPNWESHTLGRKNIAISQSPCISIKYLISMWGQTICVQWNFSTNMWFDSNGGSRSYLLNEKESKDKYDNPRNTDHKYLSKQQLLPDRYILQFCSKVLSSGWDLQSLYNRIKNIKWSEALSFDQEMRQMMGFVRNTVSAEQPYKEKIDEIDEYLSHITKDCIQEYVNLQKEMEISFKTREWTIPDQEITITEKTTHKSTPLISNTENQSGSATVKYPR